MNDPAAERVATAISDFLAEMEKHGTTREMCIRGIELALARAKIASAAAPPATGHRSH